MLQRLNEKGPGVMLSTREGCRLGDTRSGCWLWVQCAAVCFYRAPKHLGCWRKTLSPPTENLQSTWKIQTSARPCEEPHELQGRKEELQGNPVPAKVRLVQAVVFPVVTHEGESWAIKKAEHQRSDAFELWCWRRLLRVPWTARRSNQSTLKEISPVYSLDPKGN